MPKMIGQIHVDGFVGQLQSSQHLDAAQGVFFARELEHISQRVRETKYPLAKFRGLIPIDPDQPDWAAESYTYYVEQIAGSAEPGSSYSNNGPRVRTARTGPWSSVIKPLTAGYGWSMQDIRANARIGRNLPMRDALATRRVIEFGLNKIAFKGDSVLKIPGFLNAAFFGVPVAKVPVGSNTKYKWAEKVANGHPEEVLADLNALANQVAEQSDGNLAGSTMVMTLAAFNLITTTRIASLNNDTIAKVFLANSPYVKELDWAPEFKGAGALIGGDAATDIVCCYARDPMVVNQIIPVDYEELSPEIRGYETVINVHARTGGTKWEQPLGGAFFWGV